MPGPEILLATVNRNLYKVFVLARFQTLVVVIPEMVSSKLTQLNVPIAGSNFGKLIVDEAALVGFSVSRYVIVFGETPPVQRHCAKLRWGANVIRQAHETIITK